MRSMQEKSKIQVRVDAYTRVCLTLIAVLLTVLVLGLWADGTKWARPAWADDGFGNNQAQLHSLLKAQEGTNARLDTLTQLLRSGEGKIQMVDANGKVVSGEKNGAGK